jgi:protein-disulfide isomerase
MPTKKKKMPRRINPWLPLTIILIIIFAGFIFYDKSPTFHKNINWVFGIEEVETTKTPLVTLIALTDTSIENPSYDLQEKIDGLKEDLEGEANLNIIIMDVNDNKGKELAEKLNLKTIPVFLFDEPLTETLLYKELAGFFVQEDKYYMLQLLPYDYLSLPETGDGHVKGVTGDMAPIKIIGYNSFSCPYCALMKNVFYQALDEYPGKIQYVYKHYNRGGIDPLLAHASECAAEQGKFWEMHDYIFEHLDDLKEGDTKATITNFAVQIELNSDTFDTCMLEERYNEKISNHTQEAFSYAINGTPGIFINDIFIGGATSYENLKSIIDSFNL